MKHFEDVWLEAEEIASQAGPVSVCSIEGIEEYAGDLLKHYERAISEDGDEDDISQMAAYVGGILFKLAHVCKEFNINSWAQLERAVNNAKIDLNDEEERQVLITETAE